MAAAYARLPVRLGFRSDVGPAGDVMRLAAEGWPDGWPVPAAGDLVDLPAAKLEVIRVVYMPLGDSENREPCIYVVIGREA